MLLATWYRGIYTKDSFREGEFFKKKIVKIHNGVEFYYGKLV